MTEGSSEPIAELSWGHINLDVRSLEASIVFYEVLGFRMFLPGIPYLGIQRQGEPAEIPAECAAALGLPSGTRANGCILGLPGGFPMLDLTQYKRAEAKPQGTFGWSRVCLASRDLAADYERLRHRGVAFVTEPRSDPEGLAKIAICLDPDGNRIELIEIAAEKWSRLDA